MSSKLLCISVFLALHSQVKYSVKAMWKSVKASRLCQKDAFLCVLGAKRKFSKLLSWMLRPPPSQASGGDRCFLRACYFRHLHDLYISASLVGGIGCRRRAENNSCTQTLIPTGPCRKMRSNWITLYVPGTFFEMYRWNSGGLKWSWNALVESAGKDSAKTLCTAEPPWLNSHDDFAKICSSLQRKTSYLEQYVIPCVTVM